MPKVFCYLVQDLALNLLLNGKYIVWELKLKHVY